ncbi:hypothetical protein [Sphingomonas nostoxanthinifaciens]|uniref:hypothetical protein n=1 Tax=Sphingomonas nostoxanthinifaciens TaxID=2872652 RepID=UPI001CC1D8E0|nr:hypothetical protein [Sphingomonas nostoxanthinifaciens]UAK25846.1 hypothetical protein K8P63_06905 [Sphingomonas nostoxanthinifaciens]
MGEHRCIVDRPLVVDGLVPAEPASVEQMVEWLDVAAATGWESYRPVWLRLLAATGGSVSLMWDGIWPTIVVSHGVDGEEPAYLGSRIEVANRLFAHLRTAGFRGQLLEALIGDGDGTLSDAECGEVGRAVHTVVHDFLAIEGRMLIEPDGTLTPAGDLPPAWGQDEANDCEIERATRAILTAVRCPRAARAIRRVVETFGERHANGWVELRSLTAPIEMAFAAWREALGAINGSGFEADDAPHWALIDFAEDAITRTAECSPRAVEARVWLMLHYSSIDAADHGAIEAANIGLLPASADRDWTAELAIGALRALAGMRSASHG